MDTVARSKAGPRLLHPDFTVGSGLSPDHAHPHHAGGLAGCTADRELPATTAGSPCPEGTAIRAKGRWGVDRVAALPAAGGPAWRGGLRAGKRPRARSPPRRPHGGPAGRGPEAGEDRTPRDT